MTKQCDAKSIYELGLWLGYLEAMVSPEDITWGRVRNTLQSVGQYKRIDDLEFIGNNAQSELASLARKYKYSYKRLFSKEDCASLLPLIHNWYGRLEEISKRWIIIVPKTKLDIYKLSSGAKSFFEEDEWSALNELEQQGLSEAARCLLANNFTASEFMALRSVESVLRRWFEWKTKKTSEHINQSEILNILDKEYPEKGRPKEISALFHLKTRRNAIAHPEVISTEEDSNATFTYVMYTCKIVNKLITPQDTLT